MTDFLAEGLEPFPFDRIVPIRSKREKGSNTFDLERFLIAKVEQLWREAL